MFNLETCVGVGHIKIFANLRFQRRLQKLFFFYFPKVRKIIKV